MRTLTSGCAYAEMSLRHPRSALRFFFFFCAELGVLRLTRGSNQLMFEAVTLTNNPGSLELSRGHRRGKTEMIPDLSPAIYYSIVVSYMMYSVVPLYYTRVP